MLGLKVFHNNSCRSRYSFGHLIMKRRIRPGRNFSILETRRVPSHFRVRPEHFQPRYSSMSRQHLLWTRVLRIRCEFAALLNQFTAKITIPCRQSLTVTYVRACSFQLVSRLSQNRLAAILRRESCRSTNAVSMLEIYVLFGKQSIHLFLYCFFELE